MQVYREREEGREFEVLSEKRESPVLCGSFMYMSVTVEFHSHSVFV
jgi:hypothetical protein